MTVRKRIPIVVLAAGGLVLSACTGGGDDSGDPLETLDIMAPFYSEVPPEEDDPIDQALSEIAGQDLSVQWVPHSEYGDKVNVTLAGDDIPDVIVIEEKNQSFVQTAEAGGFWDLTEHLASGDYPNLVTENPEVQEAASVNGTVYGVYRARDVIRHSVIIRSDWLDNLGLEVPETTDDLMELARAFTEDDPDGNGEDDTYGMINIEWPAAIGTGSPYDAIEVWHGAGNVWKDDGGTLVPSFETPEWQQAIEYERELVENGYLNPDYATMAPEDWNTPFLNGEGGIIIDVQSRATELVKLFKEQNPDDFEYVALAGQLEGPNGTFAMPTAGHKGILAIPRAGVQTEEQLEQVLTTLNELNTTEAQNLMNNGIEGDNYTVEDGFAVRDPEKQDFTDQVTGAWAQLGMNVAGYNAYPLATETEYEQQLEELRLELQAEDLENAVFNPAAGLVSDTYTTNGVQLDTMIADARIQYIDGQLDDAGLQDVIDQWHASGGDDLVTELNDLYSELN